MGMLLHWGEGKGGDIEPEEVRISELNDTNVSLLQAPFLSFLICQLLSVSAMHGSQSLSPLYGCWPRRKSCSDTSPTTDVFHRLLAPTSSPQRDTPTRSLRLPTFTTVHEGCIHACVSSRIHVLH